MKYLRRRLMMAPPDMHLGNEWFFELDAFTNGVPFEGDLASTSNLAFTIDSTAVNKIWIGRWQAHVTSNKAYSDHGMTVTNASFNNALTYCANRGTGYHLMTNQEWAALALWCLGKTEGYGRGVVPRGNNKNGKDNNKRDKE